MDRSFVWLLGCAVAVGLGGCIGQIYNHGSLSQAASVSPRAQWKISGDLQGLPNAIDGNVDTRAVSNGDYTNGAFTLDLGRPCLFNMVIIDHGPGDGQYGFCGRVAVLTSLDGKTFTRQHIGPGLRRVTIVSLITPVLARYVRVQAVRAGPHPWSVAEVYLR